MNKLATVIRNQADRTTNCFKRLLLIEVSLQIEDGWSLQTVIEDLEGTIPWERLGEDMIEELNQARIGVIEYLTTLVETA